MKIGPAVAAALLGVALAGCAAPPAHGPDTAGSAGSGAVSVREHLSGRWLALIGPKAQLAPPYLGIPGTNFYCLRSFIDRQNGESADQIYVAASYDSKRDWEAAHDGAGRELQFVPISRQPIVCNGKEDCSYAEEFAANLPAGELRANPEGLAVTFTDQAGSGTTITVSKDQIAAQLAALASQGAAARPPTNPSAPGAVSPPAAAAHQP
jgi:hypothetical protein